MYLRLWKIYRRPFKKQMVMQRQLFSSSKMKTQGKNGNRSNSFFQYLKKKILKSIKITCSFWSPVWRKKVVLISDKYIQIHELFRNIEYKKTLFKIAKMQRNGFSWYMNNVWYKFIKYTEKLFITPALRKFIRKKWKWNTCLIQTFSESIVISI